MTPVGPAHADSQLDVATIASQRQRLPGRLTNHLSRRSRGEQPAGEATHRAGWAVPVPPGILSGRRC